MTSRGAAPVLAGTAFGLPLVVLAAQRALPSLDPVLMAPSTHLLVVTGIAAVSGAVALAAAVPALRRRRAEPLLLAAGCLWLSVLFMGHGLSTPGVLGRADSPWVVRLPVLALVGFGLCQLLGVQRRAGHVRSAVARSPWLVLGAVLAAAVLLVGYALASTGGVDPAGHAATAAASADDGQSEYGAPRAMPGHEMTPATGGPAQDGEAGEYGGTAAAGHASHGLSSYAPDGWQVPLCALTAVLLALAGLAHLRRWRVGRDGVELALALACGTAGEAAVALLLSDVWDATWWDYHGLLLAGFSSTVVAVWLACRRGADLPDVLDGRWLRDPTALLAHGSPEVLHALVAAVEAKHQATRGHSARVSAVAVQIAARLGMSPEQLRTVAQGALLHDIGKIGVPDSILAKPGPLTAEERARVEEHPVIGWEIVRQAPSLATALDAIRHHHERVDGTGYPDRLAGDQIPLLARVVAVADVYDALTSARDYRPAWLPGRALAQMLAARGTHFDPRCLDALLALRREEGHVPDASAAETDGSAHVVAALAACHEDAPAHVHVPSPRPGPPAVPAAVRHSMRP